MSSLVQQQLAVAMSLFQAGKIEEASLVARELLAHNPMSADALHLLGVMEGLRNRHTEAEALLLAAASLDQKNHFIHFNLARSLSEQGKDQDALRWHTRALELDSTRDKAWLNYGLSLHRLGDTQSALSAFDRALSLNGCLAEGYVNKGNCLREMGAFDLALAEYDQALKLDPSLPEAWSGRGNILNELKRHEDALVSYERSIELKPDYAEAWYNRGIAFNDIRLHEEALASFNKSIELEPQSEEAWCNRGNALNELKRHEDALASYERSIELKPDYAEAWYNRGITFNDLGRHEEALASYDHAIRIKPNYSEAWLNRGNVLNDLRLHGDALASYNRSIELMPDCADAWSNRGVALNDLRRHEEALASYDRAIEIKPTYADAYWNKSLDLLRLGDFERGWHLYEWRWLSSEFPSRPRNFSQPLWLGEESLAGKAILLHSEQGFGDSIQFCRYAKLVKGLGARVILEVQHPLAELLTTLDGADEIVERGSMLPSFDYHCPLLSLPLALKTTVASIPQAVPYLHVSANQKEQWSRRVLHSSDRPSVGIVWAGNPSHKNNHNRSICLETMSPLFTKKLNWVSLQRDVRPEDAPLLEALGIRNCSAELSSFSDTAGLISQLDLVIAVDTSVAHLAGALGKPVWVLIPHVPDFRWMWDRNDSPWYPTMRLLRQTTEGDWVRVISNVDQALSQMFGM